MIVRTGIGIDIHAFDAEKVENNSIIIGGISIKHPYKIKAHSDGDVIMHSITEALFGAIAAGNIGQHFPSSDPQWKDANSEIFVRYANEMVRNAGWNISNIDCVVICEAPKIMPHSLTIRSNIANVLSIDIEQISVKATTAEKMGFLGRKEGIAAQAICTLIK